MIIFITTNAQVTPPSPYPVDVKVNYIRTWEPQIPISDPALVVSKPVSEVKQTTQYLDGLGRPIQMVSKQSSPLQKDVVTARVYDESGREQYNYLPFVSTVAMPGDVTNDGKFKQDPFQQQKAFSQTQYPGETFFYGKTEYEASPLNRVTKSMAAGNSWSGSNKGIGTNYEIAGANEVRIWDISIGSTLVLPTSTKFYDAGQLYRIVIGNEHGKRTIEYKDKSGQVVLKKIEIAPNAVINSHTGWLCTYYVYDDFNNLRFVISPKAVEQIAVNWTLTTAIANELCFQYLYDGRKRMIIKKAPGVAEIYMVYDARDRMIMSQDINLKQANKWMITLYDGLNRPVQTGLLLNTFNNKTVTQHQDAANLSSAYPFVTALPPPASQWEMLTETHYDDYAGLPVGFSSTLINTYINATNFITSYNTAPLYAQQLIKSSQTINKVTWAKVKVLGTADYLNTVMFYDEKGRLIQQQSTNVTGAIDIITTQYDWSGKVLRSHQHQKKAGLNPKEYQVLNKYSYDHAGRLLNIKKVFTAGGLATPEKTIVQNSYDELGQLKTKKLGQQISNPALPIESLVYDYNIRSWLLGVNRDYVKDANSTNYFGFELGYDKPNTIINATNYTNPQFNGNISGTIWKSKGDEQKRKYDFSYDAANRILKADFNQYTAGTFNKTAKVDFSSVMGDGINPVTAYDANGNILAMKQLGLQLNSSPIIDQLSYSYHINSNKLKAVNDAIVADNKLGDFTNKNTTADDYGYDKNGNLITDLNKKLVGSIGIDQIAGGAIQYNYLNLPKQSLQKG
ncbi:MAG: hypothetical protein IPJ81_03760 [Chitinophagaceae bacterium]|nr:hypothetical protein [Chitinophagaceae bacterium]